MSYYSNELRKIADFHSEQATSLRREHSDDAIAHTPELAAAINAHEQQASQLHAEAEETARRALNFP